MAQGFSWSLPRTARLVQEGGVTVATGDTTIGDEDVFGLIDAGRR
jgi:hypothetical protein